MTSNTIHTLPKREEIDAKFKWKLEGIYPDIAKWEADYSLALKMSETIFKYKGTLKDDPQNLAACLKERDTLTSLADKIFVFAKMKRDEDNENPIYQALTDKANSLITRIASSISFIEPEILHLSDEAINEFVQKNNDLKVYRQYFNEILRQKKHFLSEREEELIALSFEMLNAPKNIFSMLNNADLKFPCIKDEEQNEVELTKGRYIRFLESHDKKVRKDAFDAMYDTYGKYKNTLAQSLISNVKKNIFIKTVRKYASCLEASLSHDNISISVYDRLIETVSNNLSLLGRYLKLRKKVLNLKELHMYDLYVPLVDESKKSIPYEEALNIVKSGLTPLGSEYLEYLEKGFTEGWIDVYENQGKTSGAYSWGAYQTHPYVLLNYQGTTNDVFTIAHEMGHAIHTFYTNKTQPYVYSEYKIFVAEVASTVNEILLMKHLLKNTSNNKEKIYLLNHFLEEFRGTVFRQTMFAEFEKIIHESFENNKALTHESISKIYFDLNSKYMGSEVVIDDAIKLEWARIPHFYNSFYVYKYATGFSAAVALSNQILTEGEPAKNRYISFLKSGSSDYPLELLKKAGVDLSTPRPVQEALNEFEKILTPLEDMLI